MDIGCEAPDYVPESLQRVEISPPRFCKNSRRGLLSLLQGKNIMPQQVARKARPGGGRGGRGFWLYDGKAAVELLKSMSILLPDDCSSLSVREWTVSILQGVLREHNRPKPNQQQQQQQHKKKTTTKKPQKKKKRKPSGNKKIGSTRKSLSRIQKEYAAAIARSCSHAGGRATVGPFSAPHFATSQLCNCRPSSQPCRIPALQSCTWPRSCVQLPRVGKQCCGTSSALPTCSFSSCGSRLVGFTFVGCVSMLELFSKAGP